ncbi:MAG: TolC family protein [Gemmatimonadota bacterium]|nr:MAG: TolC family protein [Gemmatimonadota bacterium]
MRIRPALALCIVLAATATGRAHAQAQVDQLSLEDAVRLAREANPALHAARLRADVVAERVPQAGALPDPILGFSLMNRQIQDFGSTAEPMLQNRFELSQRLPWPGKLGFSEERSELLASAGLLEAEETEELLIARVKAVYYRLAFMDRALLIMENTRELLRDFLDVSSTLYAVGEGLQQDVLQAQVAVASMTEDITVMEQDRLATAARLNALLGREATAAIGRLELPSPGAELPSVEALMELADAQRPGLQAARGRARAAAAGYRAAGRAAYPDFMVGVAYSQRPQYNDWLSFMVGISLPLWAGKSHLPLRREMAALQAEQEARVLDLYNETFARIAEQRAEAERARKLLSLYATSILPQARAAVESALSAYRVGKVDFMTLVQNELTVNRFEIESVRWSAEYQRAVAELEALVGSDFGGAQ